MDVFVRHFLEICEKLQETLLAQIRGASEQLSLVIDETIKVKIKFQIVDLEETLQKTGALKATFLSAKETYENSDPDEKQQKTYRQQLRAFRKQLNVLILRHRDELSIVLPSLPPTSINLLRKKVFPFIGREKEQDLIIRFLNAGKSVLIYGFPGEGKSALALTVVHERLETRKENVLWIDIGADKSSSIFELIIHRLEEESLDADSDFKAIDLLKEHEIKLLILDDIWDGDNLKALVDILPPEILLLATARQEFATGTECIRLEELKDTDALEVLAYYAKAKTRWEGDQAKAALEICRNMANNAYGLSIAGNIIFEDEKPPTKLQNEISIETPQREGFDKRENIESMIQVSLEALEHKDKFAYELFIGFGAFSTSSVTRELLTPYLRIIHGGHFTESQISQAVRLLKRRVLIEQQTDIHTGLEYYYVHSLAYQYVCDRSTTDQRLQATEACLQFISKYQFHADALHLEIDNLLGAASLAAEKEISDTLTGIMQSLATGVAGQQPYVDVKGYSLKLLDLLGKAINTLEKSDKPENDPIMLNLLAKQANGYYEYEEYQRALESYRRAVPLAEKLSYTSAVSLTEKLSYTAYTVRQVRGLYRIMDILTKDEKFTEAKQTLDTAEKVIQEALKKVEIILQETSEEINKTPPEKRESTEKTLKDAKSSFVRLKAMSALVEHGWGYYHQAREDHRKALKHFRIGMTLLQAIPENIVYDVYFITLLSLGTSEQDFENFEAAIKHHNTALAIGKKYEVLRWQALAQLSLSEDYYWKGDKPEARKQLAEAHKSSEEGYEKKVTREIKDFLHYIDLSEILKQQRENNEHDAIGSRQYVGGALVNIAEELITQREYQQAQRYLKDAHATFSDKPKDEIMLRRIAVLLRQIHQLKRRKKND